MKASAFSYVRPLTVTDAIDAFGASGDEGTYIAGGQSLVPVLALRLQTPQTIIDIAHIEQLRGIELQGEWLRIGALTRHCAAISDPLIAKHAPLFHEAAPYVAHPAIRNKGTLGGSIALADPASEFPAMALAMRAEFEIASASGTRHVPADQFFLGLYETAMEPGEILVAIHVPIVRETQRWAFSEIARRRGDYALAGAGVLADFAGDRVEEIRLTLFSVSDRPIRAVAAEKAITGSALTAEVIQQAQAALADDLEPLENEQVPVAMRMHLTRVVVGRLLGQLARAA